MDKASLRDPKLILRSYNSEDFQRVQELFIGTYYGLVSEGIRAKLRTPWTWLVWILGYFFFQTVVPTLVFGQERENSWPEYFLKLFLTFWWVATAFIVFFIMTAKYELVDRVNEAQANDMSDPATYYLNYTTTADNKLVQKPAAEQSPSHFWVLSIDNALAGIVGLAVYNKVVKETRNKDERKRKAWWTVDADLANAKDDIFAEPTPPKTAILQRLAITPDYQNCGLANLLINRAMFWAQEHGIEKVVAYTNEMQRTAEKVLMERHGFKLEHTNKKWLSYQKKLVCDVQAWIDKYGEESKGLYEKRVK